MSEANIEKKKINLKINVSKKSDTLKNQVSPQIITEWNYMRIILALLIMIGLIIVGIIIFKDEDGSVLTETEPQKTQIKDVNTDIKIFETKNSEPKISKVQEYQEISIPSDHKQASTTAEPLQVSGELVRAQLAKGIWKDEPFGNIIDSIKVNDKEATGIFYFTELKNMKGKTVFHIWKFEDKIIYKKKKEILENNWKTYSSKLFTMRSIGFWSVETVNSNDQQLNIINFDVVAD